MSLEEDDLSTRMPIVHPLPMVEFGLVTAIKANGAVVPHHPQKEPDLFLAYADRTAPSSDVASRQGVAQPPPSGTHHLHVLAAKPELLEQLPEHGLLRGLVNLYASLGELPGFLSRAPRPQDFGSAIDQDDAHVRPEAIRIDQRRLSRRKPAPFSTRLSIGIPGPMQGRLGRGNGPDRGRRGWLRTRKGGWSSIIVPTNLARAPRERRAHERDRGFPKLLLAEHGARSPVFVDFNRDMFKRRAATVVESAGMGTSADTFYTRRIHPDDFRFRATRPTQTRPSHRC